MADSQSSSSEEARPKTQLVNLPNELLYMIFEQLSRSSDLASVSLVSRRFYGLANYQLYEEVGYVHPDKSVVKRLRLFCQRPELGQIVKRLHIEEGPEHAMIPSDLQLHVEAALSAGITDAELLAALADGSDGGARAALLLHLLPNVLEMSLAVSGTSRALVGTFQRATRQPGSKPQLLQSCRTFTFDDSEWDYAVAPYNGEVFGAMSGFLLPSVRSLHLMIYSPEPWAYGSLDTFGAPYGSSQVKNLFMYEGESAPAVLARVIRLPASLRRLNYIVGADTLDAEYFQAALNRARSSLEELLLDPQYDQYSKLSFQQFPRLRYVTIPLAVLIGDGEETDRRLKDTLPFTLERLTTDLRRGPISLEIVADHMVELIEGSRTHQPGLKSIRIHHDEPENATFDHLKVACADHGIEFTVDTELEPRWS